MTVVSNKAVLRNAAPPWLQRSIGGRFLDALGGILDLLETRAVDGVSQRFPGVVDNSSLAMVGRERRIRRGPGESAETYSNRLVAWWDRHRIRGGPYALLGQLHDFFRFWLPGRKDVVYHSGTRRWADVDGNVTRDAVTWDADGSAEWSQVWVFFYVPATIPLEGDLLVTTWNEIITTLGGDPIVTSYTVNVDSLTPAEEEVFRCIPREWSAAHIKRMHVVLLYDTARLWGYPQPFPLWSELEAEGHTWGGPIPAILEIEG